MADTSFRQPRIPLGLGSIIGESFSIFFKHFILIFNLAFIPNLLDQMISGLLTGFDVAVGTSDPRFDILTGAIGFMLSMITGVMARTFAAALLVQLAYDVKLNKPVRPGRYFVPVFGAILPLIVLGIISAVLVVLGFVLLIVPGLWLGAVFFLLIPVLVIERVGFGGLSRSDALTRPYRWPIMGLLVLVYIFVLAMNFIAISATESLVASGGILSGMILNATLSAVIGGLDSILVALVYVRLREIREGVNVDQIASVFD